MLIKVHCCISMSGLRWHTIPERMQEVLLNLEVKFDKVFFFFAGFACPFVPFLPAACILINTYLVIDLG